MKYSVAAVGAAALIMVSCLCSAQAQTAGADLLQTSQGPVEIDPIHHASLMLVWKNEHILIDPAPIDSSTEEAAVVAPYKRLAQPDFILITHIHGDHFNVPILRAVAGADTLIIAPQNVRDAMPADLQAKTQVMKNGEHAKLGAVEIQALPMYNITPDRLKFHPKGLGNGYLLGFGDKRVYIAGDTEETGELAHLRGIDVAFIPMNLPFTETVDAAAKWVRDFRPKIVFPYHYRNQDGSLSDMAKFESEVGNASIVRLRKWY